MAGRYRLGRPLGHGGMATVFAAGDEELQRPVAVKLLAESIGRDPDLRARFLREARLAARLSHPNVVRVFDAGEADGRPYIVMELVDGETVADLLARRGRLDPAEAVALGRQAAAGLQHAHDAGLVHRDVKPQNLLLRPDGKLEIADFGIARAAETTRLTLAGTVLGTAAYLAPEQALGEDVGPAADVYSLGAVLYELLAGEPPFRFESLGQLASERPPLRPLRELAPDVPQALEDVVMRTLARNPAYRTASAAELGAELAAAVPDPGSAPTERDLPPTRIVPPRRRRRRIGPLPILAGLALLLAVVVVGVAIGLTRGGGGTQPRKRPAALRIAKIPRGTDAAAEARNLASWIGRYSAAGP